MDERTARLAIPALILLLSLGGLYVALRMPGYLSNPQFYGGLIFLQIVMVILWKF